jgi:CRP-like cAMP-binding protein
MQTQGDQNPGRASMKFASTDEMLAKVPLFEGLSKKELREISNLATRMNLPAGRRLTRQGAIGQEFVIVLEGRVDVLIDDVVVASPEAGQFYGEIALLEDRPRMATVVAKTDVAVDIIGRREFAEMLERQPEIADRLQKAMAERLAAEQGDA